MTERYSPESDQLWFMDQIGNIIDEEISDALPVEEDGRLRKTGLVTVKTEYAKSLLNTRVRNRSLPTPLTHKLMEYKALIMLMTYHHQKKRIGRSINKSLSRLRWN